MLVSAAAALSLLMTATTPRWRNSTEGIHAWLPFDGESNGTAVSEYATSIDFVWGSSQKRIPEWRAKNPGIVLAKYMPYTRDPNPVPHTSNASSTADCRYFKPGCPTALPWWRDNKPELILYQCDRAQRPPGSASRARAVATTAYHSTLATPQRSNTRLRRACCQQPRPGTPPLHWTITNLKIVGARVARSAVHRQTIRYRIHRYIGY
eukprot:COSAG01_NODE_14318_length_1469_cov_2.920438_2_plen_208_part_00